MNWQNFTFDWNQARAFLATAETGSLTAAARDLGLTQPTLSRQVTGLEAALGLALFDRIGRNLVLSPVGLDLLDHFRAMGEAAGRVSLAASGPSQTIEGQVSITASDAMSTYILPPILKRLRDEAPGIFIEVIAANDLRDLQRREADIAIRHVRPDQPDLIARLLRQSAARFFASTEYLDRHGRQQTPADLSRADFVGFAPLDRLLLQWNQLGLTLTRANFRYLTDNGVVMAEMLRQGLGVGMMPQEFSSLIPELEPVLPSLEPIPVEVWLVSHRELLTSRRIRIVFDLLAGALG